MYTYFVDLGLKFMGGQIYFLGKILYDLFFGKTDDRKKKT